MKEAALGTKSAGPKPAETGLHEMVEARALQDPLAPALIHEDRELSYGEMDRAANQLARYLIARGVGTEIPVGICMPRSREMMIAILAVLKAGGAYVPLDPAYPADRLTYMIADCGAALLLTQRGASGRFHMAGASPIYLPADRVSGDWAEVSRENPEKPRVPIIPEQLAYLIYTSGSTGKPKGVYINHGNAVALLRWARDFFTDEETRFVLASTSICFDVSVFELFMTLGRGGALVMVDNLLALPHCPHREYVTLINSAPSGIAELVDLAAIPFSVRVINLAGEPFQHSLITRLYSETKVAKVYNLYGPTEDTSYSTGALMPLDLNETPSIGCCIDGGYSGLFNQRLEPPAGRETGELCLGGAGLARGYHRRPDLTAARFIPNPPGDRPGDRLYRSGDLVSLRADGDMVFQGRIDHQVKIHGIRIELGEIEAALAALPGVGHCLVMARADTPGDKFLVAYIQRAEGVDPPDRANLRALLLETLPAYMVPADLVFLDSFPLTPNGKVDRKALPVPQRDRSMLRTEYVAPRNATEEALARIWSEVLRQPKVGIHDRFLMLGGHSLLTTQIVSRIRDRLGVNLSPLATFDYPTVARLANHMQMPHEVPAVPQGPRLVAIDRGPYRKSGLPLSFAQQRLWFAERYDPNSPLYNVPTAYQLCGSLDPACLERALALLVRRHESLRTHFRAGHEGAPVQVIGDPWSPVLTLLDLQCRHDPQKAVQAPIMAEARRPFALDRGPLMRCRLFRLGKSSHLFLFNIHHIVFDGWSRNLFLHELGHVYAAELRGTEAKLARLPVRYSDYAIWQRDWLHGENLERQLDYWRGQLANFPTTALPADRPRPVRQTLANRDFGFVLPAEMARAIGNLAVQEGATTFMALLAAWFVLLSRYSGQADVVVGTPVAGRTRGEIEPLIGFFVNSLVMRADLSPGSTRPPGFRELLRQTRHTVMAAFEHQDLPFEKLVEALQPERDTSRHPVFQVVFALNKRDWEVGTFPGLSISGTLLEGNLSPFDLILEVEDTSGDLAGRFFYNVDLFCPATIRDMAANFLVLLSHLLAEPERPAASLPLLNPAERKRLLVRWNSQEPERPAAPCIAAGFETHTVATPDAVAVVHGPTALSYGALDHRAKRLAAHLKSLGVGPETLVGSLLERSPEALICLLAILKAGGVYVPLDPELPRQRLGPMVGDMGMTLMVSRRGLADALPEFSGLLVRLDEPEAFSNPPTEVETAPDPSQLAYVIHTSGSSGKPKGVCVPHGALGGHLLSVRAHYALGPVDRCLQFAALSFDISLELMLAPLISGACLVSRDDLWDPGEFSTTAARLRLTVAFLPTAFWRLWARELDRAGKPAPRLVYVGGEAMDLRDLREWQGISHRTRLVNAYGPTETVISPTTFRVPDDYGSGGWLPIGRTLPNRQAYVLDGYGRLVPRGVIGELHLGGKPLARGYLHQPERTASQFVANPFADKPGVRFYKTGDLVRFLADGNLLFQGRVDQQIKIRGFRIEPGDIEACLKAHPFTREVLVLARGDRGGSPRLVAYVALAGQHPAGESLSAMREHARKNLPSYMVPTAFVFLEGLPLTPGGKVDRRFLPEPRWDDLEKTAPFEKPASGVEQELAAVWSELLQIAKIGRDDNFFELGGHSLLAARAINRINQNLGASISVRTLFENPRLAQLAAAIGGPSKEAHGERPVAAVVEESAPSRSAAETSFKQREDVPLSLGQRRLWFADQLDQGNPVYNITLAYQFNGGFDFAAFEKAWRILIERHEILRTIFATDSRGEPLQKVLKSAQEILNVIDTRGLAISWEVARLRFQTEANRAFRLERGPLLLGYLFQVMPGKVLFLLNMHHIIADGWSLDLMMRELSGAYSALARGEHPHLPTLGLQYADYANWQQQNLAGPALEKQLCYWNKRLDGLTPLALPTDHVRPPRTSFDGGLFEFHLPQSMRARLQRLVVAEEVTGFMILLAGFYALLFRYTGQEDLVVGTTSAGRSRAEFENLIGFFVNTLALRTSLRGPGNPASNFLDLLREVRATTLEAFENQDTPFDRVVETIQLERDMSRHPIFQVMFSMFHGSGDSFSFEGLATTDLPFDRLFTHFDLTLEVKDTGDALQAGFTYSSALFDRTTIRRLAGHYITLLSHLLGDPTRSVASRPLLTDPEREQLLVGWNDNRIDYPLAGDYPSLFEARAARVPDALAVTNTRGSLTYAELNRRANRVARRLRSLGAGPETSVGNLWPRSPEMLIGLLAILKTGAVYVPLDPELPEERRLFIMGDTAMRLVVSRRSPAESLAAFDGQTLLIEEPLFADETGSGDANLATPGPPQQLAYVIYTSGSTGTPKGVAVPRSALLDHIHSVCDRFELCPSDRVLQFAALSFDVSLEQMLPALVCGAVLVLREGSWSPPDFSSIALRFQLTVANLPTAFWNVWCEEGGRPAPRCLRLVIAGGEAMSRAVWRAWSELNPHPALINAYGPTETVITPTMLPMTGEPAGTAAIPIGRALPNRDALILDRRGQPVPIGVVGELHLGGRPLARGYLGGPGLTAASFVPHPFAVELGARIYKTGDLARFLSGGLIEFAGRVDQQVKIRGFRIEPGEISAVLQQHEAVRESAVLARRDRAGETRLVAYVVLRGPEESAAAVNELEHHLARHLPAYMVPSSLVFLPDLPLTPSGKVDRRALPEPDPPRTTQTNDFQAPRTSAEKKLAAIWSELLDHEPVGLYDNFFRLGGHSLLATRMIPRIQRLFRVSLPLVTLFENPTIAGLAEVIFAAMLERLSTPAKRVAGEVDELPLRGARLHVAGEPPLSFAQQRMWFFQRMEPENPAYNSASALRLAGDLYAGRLERALRDLGSRHEMLRTHFAERNGQAVQVIEETSRLSLGFIDLARLEDAEALARDLMSRDAARAFDLSRTPLFRCLLMRLGPRDRALFWNMHHIVCDGWSHPIFARELRVLYQAHLAGTEPVLTPLFVQYADFAVWQRRMLTGDDLERPLHFWKKQLAGVPPLLELPADRPRPVRQDYAGAAHSFTLPRSVHTALATLTERRGITPFMALLAGYAVLLARYSGQDDIVVGAPIANRDREELEALIGFFVNTLALRVELAGQPSFAVLLERVRARSLAAFQHQDLPFEKLVEALQPERSLSFSPIFQTLFVLQNAGRESESLTGFETRPFAFGTPSAQFDLILELEETAENPESGFSARLVYSTALFEREMIARMADHYRGMIETMLARPEQRITQGGLLTGMEREQLLRAWNRTQEKARPLPFHRLFEERVPRQPAAIMLVRDNRMLTYEAVNRRANLLARTLLARGLMPEQRVAVVTSRTPATIVAMLAIFKAGGVYLPMDPTYPEDRRAYMLADSDCTLILTAGESGAVPARYRASVMELQDDPAFPAKRSPADLARDSDWGQLAYIIYTSGSTGRPKGVAITHRGLGNLADTQAKLFRLRESDRYLQFASMSFDASISDFVAFLNPGIALILGAKLQLLPGAGMAETLKKQCITVGTMPPSALAVLPRGNYPHLRILIVAGEACPTDLPNLWAENHLFINAYGPTESTVCTLIKVCRPSPEPPPIGRPLANTRLYVVDARLQPIPRGVAGELCSASIGLARGYLGRPAQTAATFIPDPFGSLPGDRLFRTGDLVRYRPDGDVVFLGRIDHLIKLRGFRIEPGEIETRLNAHEAVRMSFVMIREDEPGDPRLVAYLVPARAGDAGVNRAEALRRWLAATLPEYMIPDHIVFLERLPLTHHGKVERAALPLPERDRSAADTGYAAPRNRLEERLAGIWQEVLHLERVGIRDNFFKLGGHSLLAIKAVSRVAEWFGVEPPLAALFENPTVAGLAAVLDGVESARAGKSTPAIPRVSRDGSLPLSSAQHRIWFFDQALPGHPAYHVPGVFYLFGRLDPCALERALFDLVQRHESLRTIFSEVEGDPRQTILPASRPRSRFIDLRRLPERQWLAWRMASREARTPFDLEKGPLWRWTLLRLEEEKQALFLTLHHIITDGWSMGLLFRELSRRYAAALAGRTLTLKAPSIQYADFTCWHREWLRGEESEKQRTYWLDKLKLPRSVSATERPRPERIDMTNGAHPFHFSARETEAILAFCLEQGMTPFMLLLAAFKLLRHGCFGETDLLTGTPIANRNRAETESVIGFFINTLVIRADLSHDGEDIVSLDLLRRVQQATIEAFTHQDYPFDKLVEELNPARQAHHPLFQVMFTYQSGLGEDFALPGLRIRRLESDLNMAAFDLHLSLSLLEEEKKRILVGALNYQVSLFGATTAARLADGFRRVLMALVEAPHQSLSALPFPRLRLVKPRAKPSHGHEIPQKRSAQLDAPAVRRTDAVPIGHAVDNYRIYIVDPYLNLMPNGFSGELCIAGEGLARGYLGRPQMTAVQFVPDPFGEPFGCRLYRTGDLADNDGRVLIFKGRTDHQVKIRGFRIELNEIEAVLEREMEITRASVRLHAGGGAQQCLVAYVQTSAGEGGGADMRDLRARLKRALPEYMVPAAIVPLAKFPLTPNGKLDHKRLPAPDFRLGEEAPESARTEAERDLADCWAEVLELERVGIHDNFFELGGHSLLATRLTSAIRKHFRVELPIRDLFENPTVAGLARLLEDQRRAVSTEETPIGRIARNGPLPLSFSQERLWFLDRFEGPSSTYNMPFAREQDGSLDSAVLESCVIALFERHEILRTTYREDDGRPVQLPGLAPRPELPLIDLSGLGEPAHAAERQRLIHEESKRPFDLIAGPVFRISLLRSCATRHALLTIFHHIAWDGWSLGIFNRELDSLYRAFLRDAPSPLEPLSLRYADYAYWQRHWLAGTVLEEQLAYWKRKLRGRIPALDLPTNRARPAIRSFRAANLSGSLGRQVADPIRRLSRDEGCSLFMTLLAAFKVLLYRYSGQDDITVGTPIAGRHRAGTEPILGCFLNTLVLRSDLSGGSQGKAAGFMDLLHAVRETTLDAFAHQDLPFEKLLEALKPERDLSRTPLFQVFFNMVNLGRGEPAPGRLGVKNLDVADIGSKFDITVYAAESSEGFSFDLTYNTDLFDREAMANLMDQFVLLLTRIGRDPHLAIGAYSLVTEASKTVLPDPSARLEDSWQGAIHAWMSRGAAAFPERIALTAESVCLSYAALDLLANRIAHHLIASGFTPGDCAAIYATRSLALVPAIYAVLKAGGTFIMLDPAYPAARLIDFIEVAPIGALIRLAPAGPLPEALASYLAETGLAVEIMLPEPLDPETFLADLPGQDPAVEVGPDHLAYIAFTSGSTGKPKGVMGRHGPLSHFTPWMNETFGFDNRDRFSMLSGLAHDPLQRDIFTPLASGATLCIPAEDDISPQRLAAWLAAQGVSVVHLTPAMSQIASEADEVRLPHLRRAFFVGEALTRHHIQRVRALAPQLKCVNYYGSTETQRSVAWYPIDGLGRDGQDRDETGLNRVLPLGKGIPGVQLLVLNSAGGLAGIGERGEVYLRGPNLAVGYLNLPELTAQRFLENPATGESGDRVYRTGDLGRYTTDGNVTFQGRADFQLKIRGYRVEPGEIEAALAELDTVREALVTARTREGLSNESYLVAYLVREKQALDRDTPATPEDPRAYLKSLLPEYMIPLVYVWLDAWPLTPNNKIDRRALPSPDLNGLLAPECRIAPSSHLESILVGIWRSVLGVARIGTHDNFFELGGHSLLATQLLSRMRKELGYGLPLRVLFQKPTVSELAAHLNEVGGRVIADPGPVPIERGALLPVSPAQQRLWFLQRLEPENPAYGIALPYRIGGALDPDCLERAWRHVLDRHEALRCCFPEHNGEPAARLDAFPTRAYAIQHHRVDGSSQALALIGQASGRPFDLAAEPLVRIHLYRISEREHLLFVHMHHIVSDGWSVGVFFEDLTRCYRALMAGERPDLPALPIQYPDFAAWQHRWLSGVAMARELDFWQEELKGAPHVLDLPADHPRPAQPSGRGGAFAMAIPAALVARLGPLCRAGRATPFMLYLAAFQVLIYRYTGMQDFLLGSPVANRNRAELEGLIGCFINTLVLRAAIASTGGGHVSFRDLLDQVCARVLLAFEHQEMTFDKLVEDIRPERDLSRNPLIQVTFNFQSTVARDAVFPGLEVERLPFHGGASQFDLSLTIHPTADADWLALFEYNADLFEALTIERLTHAFRHLLEGVAAAPDTPISRIPLMDAAKRERLLTQGNATEFEYPRESALHHLIAQQAQRGPDRIAVSSGPVVLSYAEVAAGAKRVAAALAERGAGPESLIGVGLERSHDMVTALLGVLQSGAAYVPLDPGHPAERLNLIIADAGLQLLLVDEMGAGPWRDCSAETLSLETLLHGEDPAERMHLDRAGSGNLAYVIFTSGSTGRPKGVAVGHASLVNFMTGMARAPGMQADDILLAVTTLSFDIAGLELYLPLTRGARVVVASRERAADPASLGNALEQQLVTVMQATPATWRLLIDAGWQRPARLKILCGGEALPDDLAALLVAENGETWNLYGPTETTIWSSRTPIDRGERVHIGRPMENTSFYVLDPEGAHVPDGVAGELLIGGDGLARGYWARPELTASRFVPDPFLGRPGARLYRTGDLVRYRHDGCLQYLNRIDFQVKVRGFRIELGEIETLLRELPAVREAAVIARDTGAGTQLAAFLVCGRQPPTPAELRKNLAARLPAYMVPATFTNLESLPLNASGKLDRPALARSQPESEETGTDYLPPRDALEQTLCELWAELLQLVRVGIGDNFFDLGGHSLLAVRLMSAVARRFGVDLPISALFKADTVADFADLLSHAEGGPRASPLVIIKQSGADNPIFLPHTVLGGVMGYRELAPHVRRPLYAFESPGLNPGVAHIDSVEAMARAYIAEMRGVQPEGPYTLAGWSMGGILVLEMAQQLSQAGEKLDEVFVIDTIPWLDAVDEIDMVRNIASVYADHNQAFLSRKELAPLDEDGRVALFLARLRATYPDRPFDEAMLRRARATYRNNQRAAQRYRPTWRGPVTVFRCLEREPWPFTLRWLESGIPHRIIDIPGNHETLMVPPNVQVLAHYLNGDG